MTIRLQPDASAVQLIEYYLQEAIQNNASDLHFEPRSTDFRVRYRRDGVLHEASPPPLHLSHRLMARLKILANLDITEKRLPQDGRFQFQAAIECRVSTCPTLHGEKIVLRIHQQKKQDFDIHALGFEEPQKTAFLKAIHQPQGLILVTGPTGSGKSLTLYHALDRLNTPSVNICTIEDPIEISLPGINQVGIHPKAGLSFHHILRAFLRQDPDIIMIGEIRDGETAEIAVNAAQTGHLVLATLHANSALEAFRRLTQLGIPNSQIANTVLLSMAQRLLRMRCHTCHAIAPFCVHCFQGYLGRTGIFEVLTMTTSISEGLLANRSLEEMTRIATTEGMISLCQAGLSKVSQGISTLEEVIRVVGQ